MKLREYDFSNPADIASWGARLTWTCPTCDRRFWRHPLLVTAVKVAIGFFAVIGAGGFVMGLKQVLGF